MNQRIDAVFENGVFRPDTPVNIADGQRVSLNVESQPFMDSCRQKTGHAPSLEEVRRVLSAFKGSLADRIGQERDER
jgi:predicted DNA-binding antitoxin AbrB/MazE fold protein